MNSKIVLDVIKPKQGPDKKWKAMVPSKEVIGCVYETSLPSDQITFLELKKFLQKNTKLEASNPDAMILRLPRDDYSKNFSPYSKKSGFASIIKSA